MPGMQKTLQSFFSQPGLTTASKAARGVAKRGVVSGQFSDSDKPSPQNKKKQRYEDDGSPQLNGEPIVAAQKEASVIGVSSLSPAQKSRAEQKRQEALAKLAAKKGSAGVGEHKGREMNIPQPGSGGFAAAGFQIAEPGWSDALSSEMSKPYFHRLRMFVEGEYASPKAIYPPKNLLFNAFEECPLNKVKVVILGQDPYHGPGQAHGLAFSVTHGTPQPPSLKNMIKEAVSCCGIHPTKSGCLDGWCRQGVLLLNSVLSVEGGKAFSHRNKGWEEFTDAVVRTLNKGDQRLVFLLWGKPSQKKGSIIDGKKHRIISCAHPSPLSATRSASPFIGSACFSRANEALEEMGEAPVDWNVE